MNPLLKKYIDNTITPEGLEELWVYVSTLDDKQLSTLLEEDSCKRVVSPFTEIEVEQLKSSLMESLSEEPSRWPIVRRVIGWAAVLLLPILLFSTYYFYHHYVNVSREQIVVSTGPFERSNITLPDGTRVKLNANTELSYSAQAFSGSDRSVSFTGEAYFEVSKLQGRHFTVKGDGYNVEVKGTKFNVSAGRSDPEVVVSLDEGRVGFTSSKGGTVDMKPGDVSTLERSSGMITVKHNQLTNDFSAWKRNEIVVRHSTLTHLLDLMKQSYGVSFRVDKNVRPSSTFTGMIPSDNLNEALDILETAYGIKTRVDGRTIWLSK